MTLKDELEILRGEPIQVFTGDPLDIPCTETSDPARLCKHPVVSVNMITYNHEPYIRQAIEGVMMQKTDFEFELVIGEDCSTDRTREICFEYQKRYPDKIRVLWCDHNLYRNPHPAGGNGERNMAHCRGEFIAFCEGDDYWIDPLKLQKQVDVMRTHSGVGFCFCGAKRFFQSENRYDVWNDNNETYLPGVQHGMDFFVPFMLDMPPSMPSKKWLGFVMTATTMIRKSLYNEIQGRYNIFKWGLRLGDATLWLGASSMMDGYYLPDVVSVYRIANTGIFQNPISRTGVHIDGIIVRLYYFSVALQLPLDAFPQWKVISLITSAMANCKTGFERARYAWRQLRLKGAARRTSWRWYLAPIGFTPRFCFIIGYLWL